MKGRIVWKTLLFLTLVILAVTLVVLPGQKLLGTANQVTWQKTVLAGNEDAAEGILLNAEMNAGRILFWESTLPVNHPEQAKTSFTALQRAQSLPESDFTSGLSLYAEIEFDISPGMKTDELENAFTMEEQGVLAGVYVLKDAIFALAEETPAGETGQRQIRLKDYASYLPLSISLSLGSGAIIWAEKTYTPYFAYRTELGKALNQFFRFPVPEEYLLSLSLQKDMDGNILTIRSSSLNGSLPIDTISTVTEEKCWVAVPRRDGSLLDFSCLPDGYGVYCLPFVRPPETGTGGLGVSLPLTDRLHNACPFGEKESVLRLEEGNDGTLLILSRLEQGDGQSLWLTVLDTETETVLQKLCLIDDCNKEDILYSAEAQDDLLFVATNTRIGLWQKDISGAYEPCFSAPNTLLQEETSSRIEAYRISGPELLQPYGSLYWDGTRFAILAMSHVYYNKDGEYRPELYMVVSVFDKTGLLCCLALNTELTGISTINPFMVVAPGPGGLSPGP